MPEAVIAVAGLLALWCLGCTALALIARAFVLSAWESGAVQLTNEEAIEAAEQLAAGRAVSDWCFTEFARRESET